MFYDSITQELAIKMKEKRNILHCNCNANSRKGFKFDLVEQHLSSYNKTILLKFCFKFIDNSTIINTQNKTPIAL